MIDGKQPRLFFYHFAVEKLKSSATVKNSAISNEMGGVSDAGIS
jgi:hypothetical protein